MAATCYFDSSVLTWDDSIAAWDEDKCYNDITLFSDAKLNVHLDTLVGRLASIDVSANSTYLLNNSNFLYNLLTPIEANSLIDLLAVCNRSFITGINASSTFTAINRNTVYKEVWYNSTSDLLTVLKAVKTFANTITSKAAVSTINSNFLYNLISEVHGSFEVFIYNSLKTNFIISINAISGKGYRSYLTLPETYSQFLVPLNKYRFKNDNLNSTLMNTEMTNIYNFLNMVYNGFSNYGGVYKWEFNKTENSLDLIFKDKVIMRVDALGNLKVKGTITENYTF